MFTNTREFKVWSLDMASSASDRWLADDGLQASGFIGAPAVGERSLVYDSLLWIGQQYKPALPDDHGATRWSHIFGWNWWFYAFYFWGTALSGFVEIQKVLCSNFDHFIHFYLKYTSV